jgi:hypothetical protein
VDASMGVRVSGNGDVDVDGGAGGEESLAKWHRSGAVDLHMHLYGMEPDWQGDKERTEQRATL